MGRTVCACETLRTTHTLGHGVTQVHGARATRRSRADGRVRAERRRGAPPVSSTMRLKKWRSGERAVESVPTREPSERRVSGTFRRCNECETSAASMQRVPCHRPTASAAAVRRGAHHARTHTSAFPSRDGRRRPGVGRRPTAVRGASSAVVARAPDARARRHTLTHSPTHYPPTRTHAHRACSILPSSWSGPAAPRQVWAERARGEQGAPTAQARQGQTDAPRSARDEARRESSVVHRPSSKSGAARLVGGVAGPCLYAWLPAECLPACLAAASACLPACLPACLAYLPTCLPGCLAACIL